MCLKGNAESASTEIYAEVAETEPTLILTTYLNLIQLVPTYQKACASEVVALLSQFEFQAEIKNKWFLHVLLTFGQLCYFFALMSARGCARILARA